MFTISKKTGQFNRLLANVPSGFLNSKFRFETKTRFFNLLWLLTLALSIFAAPAVEAANKKPKAVIDKILAVNEGDVVTLNGSNSSDAEGPIASYHWEKTKGLDVTINNADSASASFTAPVIVKTNKPTKAVKLTLQLTVKDGDNAESSKTVVVNVKPVNALPVANAGADKTVALHTATTLNGGSSTDDGQIVSYTWKQLNASKATKVKLTDANKAEAGFTTSAVAGVLEFELTVTDNDKKKATDIITVNVSDTPELTAGFDVDKTTLNKGNALLASINEIAGGVGPYTVKFDWGDNSSPDQTTLAGGELTKSANHTYAIEGVFTAKLTLTDANGISKSETKTITVTLPALSAEFTLNNTVILAGDTVIATAKNISSGTAPYKVKFEWGDGTAIEEFSLANGITSKSTPHRYVEMGEYALKITVIDANNATKTFTVPVTVQAADPLGLC